MRLHNKPLAAPPLEVVGRLPDGVGQFAACERVEFRCVFRGGETTRPEAQGEHAVDGCPDGACPQSVVQCPLLPGAVPARARFLPGQESQQIAAGTDAKLGRVCLLSRDSPVRPGVLSKPTPACSFRPCSLKSRSSPRFRKMRSARLIATWPL